jgi:chromosome segregation ATPase
MTNELPKNAETIHRMCAEIRDSFHAIQEATESREGKLLQAQIDLNEARNQLRQVRLERDDWQHKWSKESEKVKELEGALRMTRNSKYGFKLAWDQLSNSLRREVQLRKVVFRMLAQPAGEFTQLFIAQLQADARKALDA